MRQTQKDRILEFLGERGEDGVSNTELNNMGIYRYGARIMELRRQGCQIKSDHIRKGLWKFTFTDRTKPYVGGAEERRPFTAYDPLHRGYITL